MSRIPAWLAAGWLVLASLTAASAAQAQSGTTATAAPPALSAYGRLPAMQALALSPSGDRYAYLASDAPQRRIVVKTLAGKGLAVVPIGEAKLRNLRWAGEGRLLIGVSKTYNRKMDYGVSLELFNVLSLNIETGKQVWLLTDGARSNGISSEYGVFEREGRWYGIYAASPVTRTRVGDAFDYSSADLYRVDLETGSGQRVADGSETDDGSRDWLVDAAGRPLVQWDYSHLTGRWRITASDGGAVLASGVDPLGDSYPVSLGRAPDLFVYQQRDPDGVLRWREMSVRGGEAQVLLERESIEAIRIDPVGGLLRGYDPSGDLTRTVAFDPALEARLVSARKAFTRSSMRLESWSSDLTRLVLHTSGGDDSGTWWMVDVKAGKAEELGWDYPDLPPETVAPARMVRWKAADGLEISGVLTLPPVVAEKGLPLVVLPHGGPASRDTLAFDWMAQAFASRGYAVLQPNFRGSSGYGQAFELAGHGEWGGKMQTDVSDGLAFLVGQGIVDPRRACVVGGSYGGYVALAGVTLQQGLYRCAVSLAGVSDLQAFWKQYARRSGGGNSAGGRSFLESIGAGSDLKAASPAAFVARADAPVLLIHGTDDTVVLPEQSEAMEKALKAAGKPVQAVRLVDEDHWLSREPTRQAMLAAAVAFVEANNPAR